MKRDGVWWFLSSWLPDYLVKQFNMPIRADTMWPTFIVYGVAIIGSVYGETAYPDDTGHETRHASLQGPHDGDVPHRAVSAGRTHCNILATSGILVIWQKSMPWRSSASVPPRTPEGTQSANLFTTVSDMFPKTSVGSVTGIGAMAGGLGGVIVQLIAGTLTDTYKATPSTAYTISALLPSVLSAI